MERWRVKGSMVKPIIVLSERMKREYLSHYGYPEDRLFVVPSAVDSSRYSPANISCFRHDIRRRHSVLESDILLPMVGGDWERKGVSQSIKSLARLTSAHMRLMVVGNGDIAPYQNLARAMGEGPPVCGEHPRDPGNGDER